LAEAEFGQVDDAAAVATQQYQQEQHARDHQ
jgi:hypothetical protein